MQKRSLVELKKIPVVVRLREEDIYSTDLMKELRIDRDRLDRELIRQPARYAWWASLHTEVAAKVDFLKDRRDYLEAKLFQKYVQDHKSTEAKHRVLLNPRFRKLQFRLRKWERAERTLKHAVRAFEQRLNALQSFSANLRMERDSEPRVKRKKEREEED